MKYIVNLFRSKLFIQIFLLKTLGTLFGMFVYGRLVGGLGDSRRYLSAELNFSFEALTSRTFFTDNFFALLTQIFPNVIASLIPSIFLGYVIWWSFRSLYYSFLNKFLFWISLLLPQFVIWSGAAGKEVIAITAFLVMIKATVNIIIKGKLDFNKHYLALALFLGYLMRPHYFIAYFTLLVIAYLGIKIKGVKTIKITNSIALVILINLSILLGVLLFLTSDQWSPFLNNVMATSKSYFLSFDGESNRLNVHWSEIEDFFANMWWGIPTSIIGPTIDEALARPLFIPVFLEGVVSLMLIFYLLFKLINTATPYPQYKSIVFYGFIPALVLAMVVHYPFGIFNPGSALRYKQALAPLFYFYPLLFMAEVRKANKISSLFQLHKSVNLGSVSIK